MIFFTSVHKYMGSSLHRINFHSVPFSYRYSRIDRIFFGWRWLFNPTQKKLTCDASNATYIYYGFSMKMRNIRGCLLWLCISFLEILYFYS